MNRFQAVYAALVALSLSGFAASASLSCSSASRVLIHHAVDGACHAVLVSGADGRVEEVCSNLLELSDLLTLLIAARDEKRPASFEIAAGSSRRTVTVPVAELDHVIENLVSVGATPRPRK